MKLFLFIAVIIAVIFGIVTFQNNAEISVEFMKWNFAGHIAIVLAVSFAVGLLSGIIMLVPPMWHKSKAARTLKKRIHELEEEQSKAPEIVPEEANAEEEQEAPKTETENQEKF